MANSRVLISFEDTTVEGDSISIYRRRYGDTGIRVKMREVFAPVRTRNGLVELPPSADPTGEVSANNFLTAFNIDYNGSGLFTITYLPTGLVLIEFVEEGWEFTDLEIVTGTAFRINGTITNDEGSVFRLVTEEVTANINQCNFYDLEITATEPIKSLWVNGTILTEGTPNVYKEIDLIRGVEQEVKIIDVEDVYRDVGKYYYDYLTPENITITSNKSTIGATVLVEVENTEGLSLEYSLDNVNWSRINKFTGQENGTKTMYVRDQFLCLKSKEYTITDFSASAPYFFVSEANSIGFKNQELTNSCTVPKNHLNTLNFQNERNLSACDYIKLQTCDKTTIQFKSNYENNLATLRNEDNPDSNISVLKKSTNLNNFKSLDGLYYKYSEGKTGIYFENGNEYDENELKIGTYTLNGDLPDFAIKGEYITIKDVGTFKIEFVTFDDNIKKRVIVINYEYSGSIESEIISSIYDLLDFEVYEFTIDWSLLTDGIYDILIEVEDAEKGKLEYLSENIDLAEEHPNTLAIESYNDNNRDIFYKYGIKHFTRIPFIDLYSVPKDETEININDVNSKVVLSTVHFIDRIIFQEMPEYLMNKTTIHLSLEYVKINGIEYVKDNSVKTEKLKFSGLYSFEADMLRAGESYTNRETDDSEFGSIEISAIINTGNGFLKS